MQRRNDIQLLRGVAVTLVFLFHLKIPQFRSGFIGVDVFFVISGFLMAITLRDVTGPDIRQFYARRLKRIMPAYLLVLACLVMLAPFLFIPPHVNAFLKDVPALLFGFSNIQMWAQTDYWQDRYFAPAMHFWSLGVELQFYLFLPVIVLFHKRTHLFTISLLALSLVVCALVQPYSAKTAFFLMPLRIWEFLAGFYLAKLGARNPLTERPRMALVMFYGALATLLLLATLPIPPRAFPWPWAVPAVAATVVILACVYEARSAAERALFAVLEYIGELSYSIYLVHFPVIVALTYAPFADGSVSKPDLTLIVQAIGLTLMLAMMSYYAVERPLRQARYRRPVLAYGALGSMVAAALAGPLWIATATAILPQPNRQLIAVYDAMSDKSDEFRCSFMSLLTEPGSSVCTLNEVVAEHPSPTMLVIGDSHADAIKEVLRDEAKAAGIRLLLLRKNLVAGYGDARPEALVPLIRKHRIGYLLLHSRTEPNRVPFEIEGLRRIIPLVEQEPVKILILEPVPTWATSIPAAVYKTLTAVKGSPLPYKDVNEYSRENAALLQYLDSIESAHITRFSLTDRLCTPQCRLLDNSGRLIYHDEHHLSLTGANYVRENIRYIMDFVTLDFQRNSSAKSARVPPSD